MKNIAGCITGVVLAAAAFVAHGQSYPSKPIRIISPSATGGSGDSAARMFSSFLEKRLGQSVIVEAKPGANQTIGTRFVVNAAPDGYTLFFGTLINSHPIFTKVNSVEATKELAPITTVMSVPLILVGSAKVPATNWQEFLAHARANPDKVNFASPNTPVFLLYLALIGNRVGPGGFPFTTVAYKGGSDTIASLINGETHFSLGTVVTHLPLSKQGLVRPLFVMGKARAPQMPNVPTAAEVGIKDFQALVYFGFWAPKATPNDIIRRLNTEAVAVTKTPEFVKQVVDTYGAVPVGNTPEECLREQQDDLKMHQDAAILANYKPE